MNKISRLMSLFILVAIILAACSSSAQAPTAAGATQAPAGNPTTGPGGYPGPEKKSPAAPAGNSNYPAPAAGTQPTAAQPGGYPAAGQNAQAPTPPGTAATKAPAVVIDVTLANGSKKTLDMKAIDAFQKGTITLEGKDLLVSRMSDALASVGASTFTKVTATGKSGTLVLTSDQVGQTYIEVQKDGTIRLVVQGMPESKWLSGWTALKIE